MKDQVKSLFLEGNVIGIKLCGFLKAEFSVFFIIWGIAERQFSFPTFPFDLLAFNDGLVRSGVRMEIDGLGGFNFVRVQGRIGVIRIQDVQRELQFPSVLREVAPISRPKLSDHIPCVMICRHWGDWFQIDHCDVGAMRPVNLDRR